MRAIAKDGQIAEEDMVDKITRVRREVIKIGSGWLLVIPMNNAS